MAPANARWADVSEWQRTVDDSYPYPIIAIRSNDGTYRDKVFGANHAWCRRAADDGRLDCFIVYCVYRENWQQTFDTLRDQVGAPHPKMIVMIDVESWGGQIRGNQTGGINALIGAAATWLGDRRRVIAYGNIGDLDSLWPGKPTDIGLIVAGYSASKPTYPGRIGWQYTDGTGYGPKGSPQGAPPFGDCDMNTADVTSAQFAASRGITGGFLMALTDQQQTELYEGVKWIREQLGPNLWGPDSSMGKDSQGRENTLRDGLAALKRTVEGVAKKVGL